MKDRYGRTINYMRISITDRCNLRCRYCMPEEIEKVPMAEILTYEEILKICDAGVQLGINRYKVTGGEPLVRKNCVELIDCLKSNSKVEQVTMTTNGILLAQFGKELKAAGLDGVNISLDSLDRATYQRITGYDCLTQVMAAIEQMISLQIPVKINTVLQAGVNDCEWEDIVDLARQYPVAVRFIELMPIGKGRIERGVSNVELLEKIRCKYPDIHPDFRLRGNGPAHYYQTERMQGSIGFIGAIHQNFCGTCNRLRLTAEGGLKPCLCYGPATNIKKILRNGNQAMLLHALTDVINAKPQKHCFDQQQEITEVREMVRIGG